MRRPLFWRLCLAFCAVSFALSADRAASESDTSAETRGQAIVISDLLDLESAGQIDVSPDGAQAVYVVTSMFDRDGEAGYLRHLWLADLEGDSPPRQLTHGERRDQGPVFSPDGRRIAFVRVDGEKPQIFVLPLAGGEAFAVTAAEHGSGAPVWSPDGARIAFVSEIPIADIDGEPPWPYERPGRSFGDTPKIEKKKNGTCCKDEAEGDEKTLGPDGDRAALRAWLSKNAAEDDPRVLTRLDIQGEQDLEPRLSFSHLFVQDHLEPYDPRRDHAKGREATRIGGGFQDFTDAVWSRDGSSLIATSTPYPLHPDRVLGSDLVRVAADGSGSLSLLDWKARSVFSPVPSPSGDRIAFLTGDETDPTYSLTSLGVADRDGKNPRLVAPGLDRNVVSAPAWSANGDALYVTTTDGGSFPLLRIDAVTGTIERLIDGPLGVREFDLAAGRLAYVLTEVANPSEVYTALADGTGARRLSDLNEHWLRTKRIAQPEARSVLHDGRRISYWVMKPPAAAGAAVPTVLAIHGGPSAMWGPGELTMWHEFQMLVGRGFGVVYANPRGSGGYGYSFRHANYRDWGHGPMGDILAALDAAAKTDAWIDRQQLVVTGGSYAGYMTAWIVSQDHRFKAAVAQRGVYELSFFFGEGNAWRLVPYHFGGYPWQAEARSYLDANSPLSFVTQIETPLLVMHADRDLRTGVNQSEMLVKSLQVLGRPVEYVRYPGEGHDLSRSGDPHRRMDRLGRIVEFFERFVDHPPQEP